MIVTGSVLAFCQSVHLIILVFHFIINNAACDDLALFILQISRARIDRLLIKTVIALIHHAGTKIPFATL